VRHPEVRLRVHPPHPAEPDHSNTERLRHDCLFPGMRWRKGWQAAAGNVLCRFAGPPPSPEQDSGLCPYDSDAQDPGPRPGYDPDC